MRKLRFAAFAAAASLMLPMGLHANHAVKVDGGKWTLIGATGIYTTGTSGSGSSTLPSFAGDHLLVELAEVDNNITWDANTSTTDFNTDPVVQAALPADYGSPTRATDGTTLGLPDHSILGARALYGAGSLAKIGVAFDMPAIGKSYTSPMRTMYIKSPYSSGQPDVMIVYQANGQEGQYFKIAFKNDLTDWDFSATGDDDIYRVQFNRDNTYDNALDISTMSPMSATTVDGTSTGTTYPMFTEAFDMNITNNLSELSELNSSNFDSLEGNLTVYQYKDGVWRIGRAETTSADWGLDVGGIITEEGATTYGIGRDDLSELIQNTSPLLRDFEAGYGYWVKLDRDATSSFTDANSTAGFLLNDQIVGATSYADKLDAGWNLLSFPDGSLRYASSGFIVADAAVLNEVVGPFNEVNVTFPGGAMSAANCRDFNADVVAQNSAAGIQNDLDVRCYWDADNAQGVLISDKQFYVTLTAAADTANYTTLAGRTFSAADVQYLAGAAGQPYLRTRYGEYVIAAEFNFEHANLAAGQGSIIATLPAFTEAAAHSMAVTAGDDIAAFTTAHSAAFGTYINTNGYDIPYDTARRGQIIGIDLNASGYGVTAGNTNLLLFAANNRFNLRDGTFIRKVEVSDVNGSVLNFLYDNNTYTTASGDLDWTESNATATNNDCTILTAAVTATTGGDIEFFCMDDLNTTGLFISGGSADQLKNFDVRESNTTTRLIWHSYVTETEANASVYGAIRRVFQAKDLAKTGFSTTSSAVVATASVSNQTYSATWADDFPMTGALYYMTQNSFKPEMMITAVTNDDTGTITWKALDVTRDPKEWFDAANDFELFWTEKERGYWVYLEDGYTNPVTVDAPTLDYTVNKHFNNNINSQKIGQVFNWMDGAMTSKVGGFVRANYTSGESYNVDISLGGIRVPMLTTGAVSSGKHDFTLDMIDFEVSSLRPDQGPFDTNITAVDGIGGTNYNDSYVLDYVKPATPTVVMSGDSIIAGSNSHADLIAIYEGNLSDMGQTPAVTLAATDGNATFSSADLGAIDYPTGTAGTITDADQMASLAESDYLADLRFIAVNGDAVDVSGAGDGVYSNMRRQMYAPIYSQTARLTLASGGAYTTVKPAFYNVTDQDILDANNVGVQFATGTDINVTNPGNDLASEVSLVFQPIEDALNTDVINFFTVDVGGGTTITVGYLPNYVGEVFYLYYNGSLYYGEFPATNALAFSLSGGNALPESTSSQAIDLTPTEAN